jgi:hypothetical protein
LDSILHRECLKAPGLRRRETPRVDETNLTGRTNGRTIVMRTDAAVARGRGAPA